MPIKKKAPKYAGQSADAIIAKLAAKTAKENANPYSAPSEVLEAVTSGAITPVEGLAFLEKLAPKEYVLTRDTNKLILEADSYLCEFSKTSYEKDTDFVRVIFRRQHPRESLWCNKNNVSYFHCERTVANYASDKFTPMTVEEEEICFEACRDGLYEWETGDWHWNPRPERSSDIPGYKSCPRPRAWNTLAGFGIELEIYCPSRKEFWDENIENDKDFLGETDGSLDGRNGIELIGKPFPYESFLDTKTDHPWKKLIKAARKRKATAHDAGKNYGMHVNISKSLFHSSLHMAKFVLFINQCEKLCKTVAQRGHIYNGSYKKYNTIGGARHACDKYEAVSQKSNCLEVRIFRSNLIWERILKNVEFCQAALVYTKAASVSMVDDETRATAGFKEFLTTTHEYKHLKEFLGMLKPKKGAKVKEAPAEKDDENSLSIHPLEDMTPLDMETVQAPQRPVRRSVTVRGNGTTVREAATYNWPPEEDISLAIAEDDSLTF